MQAVNRREILLFFPDMGKMGSTRDLVEHARQSWFVLAIV